MSEISHEVVFGSKQCKEYSNGVMPVPTKGKSSSQTTGFSTDNAGAEE